MESCDCRAEPPPTILLTEPPDPYPHSSRQDLIDHIAVLTRLARIRQTQIRLWRPLAVLAVCAIAILAPEALRWPFWIGAAGALLLVLVLVVADLVFGAREEDIENGDRL